MGRVGVVLPQSQAPQRRLQPGRQGGRFGAGGDARVGGLQPGTVGGVHLHRQDGLARAPGGGELLGHHIVAGLQQVRGHRQHEQAAFLQCPDNGGVEVLARGQKLVVPDGDVPAEVVLVDEVHESLGLTAVLLAVAQKDVGVEGGPNLGGQFVPHQHRVQILFQLFGIGQGGGVGLVRVQALQIAAFLVEDELQARLLQNRQHRDVQALGQGELPAKGRGGGSEQAGGHRHDKQLHVGQGGLPLGLLLLRKGGGGVRVVPDSAVRRRQQVFGDRLQEAGLVVGVAAKPHPGLAPGAGRSAGDVGKRGHGGTSLFSKRC